MNNGASAQEHADVLLRRFLDFTGADPLDAAELQQLIAAYWTSDEPVERLVRRALADPPAVPARAAELTAVLCDELRNLLADRPTLDPDDVEAFNLARERRALCFAALDSWNRHRRLRVAVKTVLGTSPPHDTLVRPLSLAILAEGAYRLATEYDDHEFDERGARAFDALVDRSPGIAAIDAVGKGSELALFVARDGLSLPAATAQEQARLDVRVRGLQAESQRRIAARTSSGTSPALDEQAQCTLLSLTGSDADFTLQGERLIDAFDDAPGLRTETIERVVHYALRLLRARAALEKPPSPADKLMLAKLLCRLRVDRARRHDADAQARARLAAGLPAFDFAAPVPPAAPSIDDAAALADVERLLAPGATHRWGLALSGGGFRAAVFHLGVLAWLAESDRLRDLDVISCVSGGSITGAAYALRLKTLLRTTNDADVGREHYVDVVEDVIDALRDITARNFRMRALASPRAILRLWRDPDYTLSERIADLFDLELFARLVPEGAGLSPKARRALIRNRHEMTSPNELAGIVPRTRAGGKAIGWPPGPWDLRYAPRGEPEDFAWPDGNSLRSAKVPEVAFNATSVNSGNAFRFLAARHGERPDPHGGAFSSRPRFDMRPYDDITTGARFEPARIPLSRVVAASAGVPGIFPPVILARTSEHASISLADGGVHDNQGLAHLFEQRCDHLLVSDASGQLPYQAWPDLNSVAVLTRATDMLMERVRELQHDGLVEAKESGAVHDFTYLHLTKDLSTPPPLSVFRPDDQFRYFRYLCERRSLTCYGVRRDAQELLARIRTDLDCFSDIEFRALLVDGYRQAKAANPMSVAAAPCNWRFMDGAPALDASFDAVGTAAIFLHAARCKFFRLPRVLWAMSARSARLRALRWIALVALAALAGAMTWRAAPHLVHLSRNVAFCQALLAVLFSAGAISLVAVKAPPSALKRRFVKLALGPLLLLAMAWAWVVLAFADPVYRRIGRCGPRR